MSAPNTPAKMLLRNLGALTYDFLILPAIWFIATLPTVFIHGGEPFQHGWPRVAMQVWLLLVTFAFLGLSWVRGGQTIGMRAWRIRLVGQDGGPVHWLQALRRFMAGTINTGFAATVAYFLFGKEAPLLATLFALALACVGFLPLLTPPHLSLFDRVSGTHLQYLPKK